MLKDWIGRRNRPQARACAFDATTEFIPCWPKILAVLSRFG